MEVELAHISRCKRLRQGRVSKRDWTISSRRVEMGLIMAQFLTEASSCTFRSTRLGQQRPMLKSFCRENLMLSRAYHATTPPELSSSRSPPMLARPASSSHPKSQTIVLSIREPSQSSQAIIVGIGLGQEGGTATHYWLADGKHRYVLPVFLFDLCKAGPIIKAGL